jgi:hypothetical protein
MTKTHLGYLIGLSLGLALVPAVVFVMKHFAQIVFP